MHYAVNFSHYEMREKMEVKDDQDQMHNLCKVLCAYALRSVM